MGSVVKPSAIPKETLRELIKILGSLEMTVLWRLDHVPEGLPKNIYVRKWWPQANVLGKQAVLQYVDLYRRHI